MYPQPLASVSPSLRGSHHSLHMTAVIRLRGNGQNTLGLWPRTGLGGTTERVWVCMRGDYAGDLILLASLQREGASSLELGDSESSAAQDGGRGPREGMHEASALESPIKGRSGWQEY